MGKKEEKKEEEKKVEKKVAKKGAEKPLISPIPGDTKADKINADGEDEKAEDRKVEAKKVEKKHESCKNNVNPRRCRIKRKKAREALEAEQLKGNVMGHQDADGNPII